MSTSKKTSLLLFALGMGGAILIGFQNCSQARFMPTADSMVLRTEEPSDLGAGGVGDGSGAGVPFPPDDSSVPPGASPSPNPDVSPNPDASPNPDPGASPSPNPNPDVSPNPSPGASPNPDPSASPTPVVAQGDLVECQMLHPNRKIVLGEDLKQSPSNRSSTRVCMSGAACLQIINAYAVRHSCSLAYGEGEDPADPQLQCTEIFPGTNGTCNNARILSDDEVRENLEILSSK